MFKHKSVFFNTIIALFISQGTFWLIFLTREDIPPLIPLWFQKSDPTLWLAPSHYIWLLPGLSIGFLAFDLILTSILVRKKPFLVPTVMMTSTITSVYVLFITITILKRVLGWL